MSTGIYFQKEVKQRFDSVQSLRNVIAPELREGFDVAIDALSISFGINAPDARRPQIIEYSPMLTHAGD